MRLHVVNLAHTNTTLDFQSCAYTEKVRKFCRMMFARGHHVTLYGGEKNAAPCTDYVICCGELDRKAHVGHRHYTAAFDENSDYFKRFNERVIKAMTKRIQKHDIICLIGGTAQKQIADAFPNKLVVEFGVGYGGTFAKYKVYESYAWMHTCYGAATMGKPMDADGTWYDTVIPGYIEEEVFELERCKSDYVLFLGRMVDRKGINVAIEACRAAGRRLVMAGIGTPPEGVEYVGELDQIAKVQYLKNARALICPTIYVEPFGNVAIEAMACGTPVISTDWGAFTETVQQGVTGYRCRTLQQFVDAIYCAGNLNANEISAYAKDTYGLGAIGLRYEQYLARIEALWTTKGWYHLEDPPRAAPEKVYRHAPAA